MSSLISLILATTCPSLLSRVKYIFILLQREWTFQSCQRLIDSRVNFLRFKIVIPQKHRWFPSIWCKETVWWHHNVVTQLHALHGWTRRPSIRMLGGHMLEFNSYIVDNRACFFLYSAEWQHRPSNISAEPTLCTTFSSMLIACIKCVLYEM